ncbi:MAG: hypothetical protein LBI63_03255 [Candidatus Ancillula sp.]|nr:hypothetical protein [Candidatus Ancillula sp.]
MKKLTDYTLEEILDLYDRDVESATKLLPKGPETAFLFYLPKNRRNEIITAIWGDFKNKQSKQNEGKDE